MFDPVKLFEDIATTNDLLFIYGAKPFLNWELTQQSIDGSETFLGMFPFTEQAAIDNGGVNGWAASTILWVGRKFDAPKSTLSSLDETEKQKYDRRLKYLRAFIDIILDNLCDDAHVELISARTFRELNKFDENTDVIGCEITFNYDKDYTN
jgi:hypothetical protein